jgi:hypothetical protein
MRTSRERTCRTCFGILLAIGVLFLFVGLLVVPVLPYFQLDAVLSPGELADPAKRAASLALLQKASGNQWLLWTAGGLAVTVASAVGLRAAWQPWYAPRPF